MTHWVIPVQILHRVTWLVSVSVEDGWLECRLICGCIRWRGWTELWLSVLPCFLLPLLFIRGFVSLSHFCCLWPSFVLFSFHFIQRLPYRSLNISLSLSLSPSEVSHSLYLLSLTRRAASELQLSFSLVCVCCTPPQLTPSDLSLKGRSKSLIGVLFGIYHMIGIMMSCYKRSVLMNSYGHGLLDMKEHMDLKQR